MWLLRTPIDRCAGPCSTSGRTSVPQQWGGAPGSRAPCRRAVQAQATQSRKNDKQQQPKQSSRNAQLYELSEEDGWGVEVAAAGTSSNTSSTAAAKQKPAAAQQPPAKKARQRGTPYVDMRSEEGIFGLTLLQKALLEQEEQGAAGLQQSSDSMQAVKANMALSAPKSVKKPKLPGFQSEQVAAAVAKLQQQQQTSEYDEDYEDEDEAQPEFQLTFDQGKAEFIDFSTGTTRSATAPADSDGLEDFGMAGWDQFDGLEEAEQEEEYEETAAAAAAAAAAAVSPRGKRQVGAEDPSAEGDFEVSLLRDLSHEDDWGLDSLTPNTQRQLTARHRRSLLDELAAEEAEADGFAEGSLAGSNTSSVQWGGSAGATGIDLEEQEQLLQRYFRPDQVKKLMKDQVEIDASYAEFRKRAVGLGASDHKMQETLRIVSGTAAGHKLVSFRSPQTRPMMEKVRQAIFNMIQSQAGTVNGLPKTARWLDLFAGTGSVGIEALSRGVREAHFVELDPIVVGRVLSKNIASCGFKGRATCHTSKAEDFLRRAAQLPRFAGGAFDFISVCPPYLLVSYPELFDLLEASPLIHPGSIVFVEYPKQLSKQVRDSIGPLQRIKDRKYGRTYVAVYAGASADEEEEMDDPFLKL